MTNPPSGSSADTVTSHWGSLWVPTEVIIMLMVVDGSGGPGRQRGGMAIRRVYRAEHDCRVRVDGARLLCPLPQRAFVCAL